MAKVWFEAKTEKEGIKIAMEIQTLEGFTDSCVMVETPKKSIAVVGSEKPVDKKKIKEIDENKFGKEKAR